MCVRPTITRHNIAETHQMHCEEHRGHIEQRDKGEKERGRNTVSTMDEAASTTDGLGSLDPDGVPGAQPFAELSPVTAADCCCC